MAVPASHCPVVHNGMSLPQAKIQLTTWENDVYPPSDDSFALTDALAAHLASRQTPPKLCLEIGSGSGFVVTSLCRMLDDFGAPAHVIATDVNPSAATCTLTTLSNHGIHYVDVLVTDLIGGLMPKLAGNVDLLLFNPPYVPTPEEEVVRNGISRAWAGGHRGRVVIDRVLAVIGDVLAEGGVMLMVTVADNDPHGIVRDMNGRGLEAAVVLERAADEEKLFILSIKRKSQRLGG